MNKQDELTLELAKNKADEIIIKKELDKAKSNFIKYMEKDLFDEINSFDVKEYNKPIKYHKPLKLKLKEFLFKINKVLGL